MIRQILAVLAVAGALLAPAASAAADPGDATSKPCAPGQHGNPHPGFKPPACDPGHGTD